MDFILDILNKLYILSNVYIYMSARKEEIKINENIAVNEPKNTTKFNKDNNNFNERTNRDYSNTLT